MNPASRLRTPSVSYGRGLVLVLFALAAVLVVLVRGAGAQEVASPGRLEVTVAPVQLTATGVTATARIANAGGAPVTELALEARGPAGVDASVEPERVGSLAGEASVLVTITVGGMPQMRPAVLVVHAEGISSGRPVAGMGSVELPTATPPATLQLIGRTRLAQGSSADLVAVVTNVSSSEVTAQLHAEASKHVIHIATTEAGLAKKRVDKEMPCDDLPLVIKPGATEVVRVRVHPIDPLRRGRVLVVVTADVAPTQTAATDQPMKIVATNELDVAPPLSDVIPEPFGAGSALILPGLVGVGGGLSVWYWDRRRRGSRTRPVSQEIWENKVWLVVAIAVSFLTVIISQLLPRFFPGSFESTDLLGATDLNDLMIATVITGIVCSLLSCAYVGYHRHKAPLIRGSSTPVKVMDAAARANASVHREVYRAGDKLGLLVRRDRDQDLIVLSPPIRYSSPDAVGKVLEVSGDKKDGNLRALLKAAATGKFDGYFVTDDRYVARPGPVKDAKPAGGSFELLVRYEEKER